MAPDVPCRRMLSPDSVRILVGDSISQCTWHGDTCSTWCRQLWPHESTVWERRVQLLQARVKRRQMRKNTVVVWVAVVPVSHYGMIRRDGMIIIVTRLRVMDHSLLEGLLL